MTKKSTNLFAALAALAAVSAGICNGVNASHASTFHHWQVHNVSYDDVLNVREYPTGKSSILSIFQNGESLQMTGPCTGGINLDQIAHLEPWQQQQVVRYQWCKVWSHTVGGDGVVEGWVYGKYIRPGV